MKTICVITGTRAEYGLLKGLMNEIKQNEDFKLLTFVTGTHLEEKYGNTYYFIGQSPDRKITEKLSLKETKNIKKANFLLVCGTRNFEDKLEKYIEELDESLSLGLPLICANPDKFVIRKTGELLICAGIMAEYYSSNGGKVYRFGKPYKDTYKLCLDYFTSKNRSIKTKEVLCIGDALETDIAGANNFGIDSLLIANGIHKDDLNNQDKLIPEIKLKNFFKKKNTIPNYVLQSFIF